MLQERRKRNRSLRLSSLEQLGPRSRLELPLGLQGPMQGRTQLAPGRGPPLMPGNLLDWPPQVRMHPGTQGCFVGVVQHGWTCMMHCTTTVVTSYSTQLALADIQNDEHSARPSQDSCKRNKLSIPGSNKCQHNN